MDTYQNWKWIQADIVNKYFTVAEVKSEQINSKPNSSLGWIFMNIILVSNVCPLPIFNFKHVCSLINGWMGGLGAADLVWQSMLYNLKKACWTGLTGMRNGNVDGLMGDYFVISASDRKERLIYSQSDTVLSAVHNSFSQPVIHISIDVDE